MHHLLFASGRRYQSVSVGKQGKLWRIHSGRDEEYPGAGSGAASEDDNLLYDYGMPAQLYPRLFWGTGKRTLWKLLQLSGRTGRDGRNRSGSRCDRMRP